MQNEPTDFIFIGELLDFESTSIDLIGGCQLRKPNDSQLEIIQREVKKYLELTPCGSINRYEMYKVNIAKSGSQYFKFDTKDKFLYSIITFSNDFVDNYMKLSLTISLLDFDYTTIFMSQFGILENPISGKKTILESIGIGKNNLHSAYNYFVEFSNNLEIKNIGKKEIENFKSIYSTVSAYFDSISLNYNENIRKSIIDFENIKILPYDSPFKLSCPIKLGHIF